MGLKTTDQCVAVGSVRIWVRAISFVFSLTGPNCWLRLRVHFMNVLVCDPISPKGIALLQQRPELTVTVLKQKTAETDLLLLVKDVQAMVVRSETKISRKVIEAAPNLRVVGRAG